MSGGENNDRELSEILKRAADGKVDLATFRHLVGLLRRSFRFSRKGVSFSSQGLADVLLKTAPLLRIRDAETLSRCYGGMTGPALAGQLIRQAGHRSAAIGGLTGAVAGAGALAPPLWIVLPAEIVGETLLIAAIEIKLVAELHEVYGLPIEGDQRDRGMALVQAWSERRGLSLEELAASGDARTAFGRGTRNQIIQMVRRRFMARVARNVSSVLPLLVGAAAGAELNRRATRDLGDAVVKDLAITANISR